MANTTISGVTGGIGNGIPPVGNNNPNPNPNPPNVGAINTHVLGLMNKIERKVYKHIECLRMHIIPEYGSNAIGSAVGALHKGSIIHAIAMCLKSSLSMCHSHLVMSKEMRSFS